MALIGYARVSTNGQDLAGQIAELQAAGCVKIYREKISGAKSDRQELRKLLRAIEPGDVLMVSRLDRLARSTRDLLNILDAIAQAGAGFRSLKDAWADTTTPHGRLILTVLAGLAEFDARRVHRGPVVPGSAKGASCSDSWKNLSSWPSVLTGIRLGACALQPSLRRPG